MLTLERGRSNKSEKVLTQYLNGPIDEDETKPEKTTETQEAELDLGPSAPTEPAQPIIDTGDSEDFNLYTSGMYELNNNH